MADLMQNWTRYSQIRNGQPEISHYSHYTDFSSKWSWIFSKEKKKTQFLSTFKKNVATEQPLLLELYTDKAWRMSPSLQGRQQTRKFAVESYAERPFTVWTLLEFKQRHAVHFASTLPCRHFLKSRLNSVHESFYSPAKNAKTALFNVTTYLPHFSVGWPWPADLLKAVVRF